MPLGQPAPQSSKTILQMPPRPWISRENAVREPVALAAALRENLGRHPVPQSDPRTRGLLVEFDNVPAGRERLRQELPAVAQVLDQIGGHEAPALVLAVNEYPPTSSDSFLMMPHVDRRYTSAGFAPVCPIQTTVVVLDFPSGGIGGELVVFSEESLHLSFPPGRADARAAVARARGHLLPPLPGTAYELPGSQPHAVLGYEAPPGASWRLVVVIAEFTASSGDAPQWRRLG